MNPFSPSTATVNIDVGAGSAAVKISNGRGLQQVRIMNNGSATAWIAFGDSAVAATLAGSMPVGSGGTEVFSVNCPFNGDLFFAAIAAGATGKIYATPGEGI